MIGFLDRWLIVGTSPPRHGVRRGEEYSWSSQTFSEGLTGSSVTTLHGPQHRVPNPTVHTVHTSYSCT